MTLKGLAPFPSYLTVISKANAAIPLDTNKDDGAKQNHSLTQLLTHNYDWLIINTHTGTSLSCVLSTVDSSNLIK